jgi:hypothetical protein
MKTRNIIRDVILKNSGDGMLTVNTAHLAAEIVKALEAGRPKIVCLCGSTRFHKEFVKANYDETMAGSIVLSVGFYPHASGEIHGEEIGATPAQKQALDDLHFRKIELADEILVLNVGGYIGLSTGREIYHALTQGKLVRYLQEGALCGPGANNDYAYVDGGPL